MSSARQTRDAWPIAQCGEDDALGSSGEERRSQTDIHRDAREASRSLTLWDTQIPACVCQFVRCASKYAEHFWDRRINERWLTKYFKCEKRFSDELLTGTLTLPLVKRPNNFMDTFHCGYFLQRVENRIDTWFIRRKMGGKVCNSQY